MCLCLPEALHEFVHGHRTGLVEKHRAALKHLDVGKSCIRFKRLEDLPLDTITQILTETVVSQGKR
jgi:hypothetical protein